MLKVKIQNVKSKGLKKQTNKQTCQNFPGVAHLK